MPQSLKILVVKSYHKGDTIQWEEACMLKALGHEVEVLVPAWGEVALFLQSRGVPVHIVNIRSSQTTSKTLKKRYLDLIAICKLRKLFRAFDVVHLHLQRARILGRLANIFRRKPVIISTIHGVDLDSWWLWVLEKLTQRIDNRTVAISRDVKRYLVEKGLPSARVSVIYNGVDVKAMESVPYTPDFLHRLIGLPSNTAFVGMIARFYPHIKGHEIFIRAAQKIHQEFPRAHFVIAGGCPFDDCTYLDKMKNLISELQLGEIVHFLGEIPHVDIPKLLDSLKVLVVPSLIREGFGLVIAEAAAREIPVIGFNIGGIPEVIEDGETGLLVPLGDLDALAEAVSFILSNPEEAKKMGATGRKRVEEKFTLEVMARNYESLFYQLVEKHEK